MLNMLLDGLDKLYAGRPVVKGDDHLPVSGHSTEPINKQITSLGLGGNYFSSMEQVFTLGAHPS
jgi:hypothetical protein